MAQIIQFEGQQLEFPDDATPEEISAILNQQFPAQQQAPQGGPVDGLPVPVQPSVGVAQDAAGVPASPAQPVGQVAPPPQDPLSRVPRGGRAPQRPPSQELSPDEVSLSENLVDQFRMGMIDIGTGILQKGSQLAEVIPGVDTQQFQEDLLKSRRMEQAKLEGRDEQFPVSSFVGRTAGNIAGLPVPGVSQGGFALRVGGNAAVGALAGFLQPTEDDADDRVNAAIGALAGGGLTALAEPFARLLRKSVNFENGQFKKEAIRDVIREADKQGIPVFADDVLDSPFVRFAGQAAEEIPVTGTSSGRVRQAAAQKVAVEKLRSGLAKGALLEDGDVDQVIMDSLKASQKARIAKKNQLWDEAAEANPGVVKLDNYRAQIARTFVDQLAERGRVPRPDALQLLFNLQAGDPNARRLLEEVGRTTKLNTAFSKELVRLLGAPDGDFSLATRQVKSDVNSLIKQQYKPVENQIIGSQEAALLQPIKEAIDSDLEIHARRAGGAALKKWKKANDFTAKTNSEFKKSVLANLAKENTPPEQVMAVLRQKGGVKSTNERLYKNLTPEGRAAVRFSVVNDALDKSLDEQGNFMAASFNRELDKSQGVANIFFKGKDKKALESLKMVLSATEAASRQFSGQQGTNVLGRRLIQPGALTGLTAGAGIFGGVGAAASTIGGVMATGAGVKAMLQTRRGVNLLTAVGKATPGTAAHDKAIQAAMDWMTRAAINSQVDEQSGR